MTLLSWFLGSESSFSPRILFLGLFVFFRVYALLRVAKDISRRTSQIGMQLLCIAVIVLWTPILWLPIYFLLRPVQRKDVLVEQEELLEYLYAQTSICQACGWINQKDHLYCVFCGEKLKSICTNCGEQYVRVYRYCPHCAHDSLDTTSEANDPIQ